MTKPIYRYLVCDLLTDEQLGYVPLADVTYGEDLSGAGEITGTLKLPKADVLSWFADPEARTAVYVLRDEGKGVQVPWGGILWSSTTSPDGKAFTGAGWASYAYRRLCSPLAKPYVSADPMRIFRDHWARLQASSRGNILVHVGSGSTPLRIGTTDQPIRYDAANPQFVGRDMETLIAGDGRYGFDYRCWTDYDRRTDIRTRRIDFGYPRLGRRTGYRIDTKVNRNVVAVPQRVRDGSTWAWRVVTTGGQVKDSKGNDVTLTSSATNLQGAARGNYPLLEDTADYAEVSSQASLDALARAVQNSRAPGTSIPAIVIRPTQALPFGALAVGDDVYLDVDVGTTQATGWFRVTGWRADANTDQTTLSLAPAGSFLYGPKVG